jgi:hypothetical protein
LSFIVEALRQPNFEKIYYSQRVSWAAVPNKRSSPPAESEAYVSVPVRSVKPRSPGKSSPARVFEHGQCGPRAGTVKKKGHLAVAPVRFA